MKIFYKNNILYLCNKEIKMYKIKSKIKKIIANFYFNKITIIK